MKLDRSALHWIFAGVLTALLLANGFAPPQNHQGEVLGSVKSRPSRISPDLQEAVGKDRNRRVRVIVDAREASSNRAYAKLRGRISDLGGLVIRSLNGGQTAALEIPASMVAALAADEGVNYISLDRPTRAAGHLETTTGAALARYYGTSATGPIDGHGIGIAILDSGIYQAHHEFLNRIAASVDFTGEGRTDDPYGHGTHVASIAAGNSHVSYGAYTGIAPAANLINVRVLDSAGEGSASSAIAGVDWCIANKSAYNIRVINLSLGAVAVDSYSVDPLCQAVRRAFNAGIVVCVAAGNNGKDNSGHKVYGAIDSPGIEPSVITVGAANTFGTDSRSDDSVASYSSSGPTRGHQTVNGTVRYDNLIKPDLIAPGNKIIAGESPNNHLLLENPSLDAGITTSIYHKMMYMSGTSMATPAVAGAAALLVERNPALTPNLVKAILQYTAQPLAGFNNFQQGAGELNVEGAVRLAGLVRPDLSGRAVGDPLLIGAFPARSSMIAGQAFSWAGGFLQRWNFVYGIELFSKYQGVYGNGVLLTDGTLLTNSTLLTDGTLLTNGTLLSSGVMISSGTLLGDGTLLANGTLLGDSTLLTDGTLLGDGVLLSDSLFISSLSTSAQQTLAMETLNGEQTSAMQPESDPEPGN